MALARLSLLKDDLKISGTPQDARLKEALLGATSMAESHTNRLHLEKPDADITEYYSPSDVLNDRLYLRNFPTGTITTIKENFGLSDVSTIASGDYTVFDDEGFVRFDDDTPDDTGINTIEVTYSPGYTTTNWETLALGSPLGDVPADLERAVMMLASKFWLDSKQGHGRAGVSSKSRGPESVSFTFRDEAMPKEVEAILDRYISLGF